MQWFKFEHGANISSFTYPIAFKRFCLVVSSTKSGEYQGSGYGMATYIDYDLTSLVRVYEDYKQDYLIFGT